MEAVNQQHGPHTAWHTLWAALADALRIPQLVDWLARKMHDTGVIRR